MSKRQQLDGTTTRRAFMKLSATAVGAVCAASASLSSSATETHAAPHSSVQTIPPASEIATWYTDSKRRFTPGSAIRWQTPAKEPGDFVQVVPGNRFQDILGFGGCFSDAACYVINQLKEPLREQLLHEMFHPAEMGLNFNRTCVGSADSAASLYSYDEGEPDPDLKRFSIEHDRAYILPILKRVKEINPDTFYFSSPWSPPGWMKWNKSMLGGSMSRQYLASYAMYFLKFIQEYAAYGVPINAITTQNEVDTDQHGQMPACTWSQECETEFITDHIGPLFEKTNTATKIWICDHNYVYWGRVISQLDDPDVRRYVNGVAFHPYVGEPAMMSKVHAAHPEKPLYFTEGSTDYNDPHYQDDWTKWAGTYTAVLQNWCSAAVAWNMATDEKGKPNIGPYPCGGILTINPRAQEIIRSGQYWAMAHFSKVLRRGARRIESQSTAASLAHIAFENPDGKKITVLTNTGAARNVEVKMGLSSAMVALAENSVATLVWQ